MARVRRRGLATRGPAEARARRRRTRAVSRRAAGGSAQRAGRLSPTRGRHRSWGRPDGAPRPPQPPPAGPAPSLGGTR